MDNIKELMLRSLDSEISEEEKEFLISELQKSPELKSEMEDYKSIRKALKTSNYNFSEKFDLRILNSIKPSYDLFGSFKNIAISSAVAILVLVASIYFMDGSLNINSLFGIHSYPVEEEFYSFLNY